MIILGINEDHNTTAAIVRDGRVLACASEERFSRIKNDTEYPFNAINSILAECDISPSQIDRVVFAGIESDPLQMKLKRVTNYTIQDYIAEMHHHWKKVLIDGKSSRYYDTLLKNGKLTQKGKSYYDYSFLGTKPRQKWVQFMNEARIKTVKKHLGIPQERVSFIDHHTGHAHYAYFASPHDSKVKTAVVTADGWGDGCNATISVARHNKIEEIHRTPMCNMAKMYRWTTLLLGMRPNEHEYKVMGLAPYAKSYISEPAYRIYKETLVVDGLDFKWKKKPTDMYFYFRDKFEGLRFDGIAAGLQRWLEELLAEWLTNIMKATGTDTIYYSGGLSMNVKANKVVSELPLLKNLYIPPSGGDESLAIGAAFALSGSLNVAPVPLKDAYLGYCPTPEGALKAVEECENKRLFKIIRKPDDESIARLLAGGKVLGRCIGGMEFGARSLGNRAVLCDPSKYENVRIINEKIKFRDFWMPFTPSLLIERAGDYIVNPKNLEAEYMTLAFDSTALAREHLKAAIHPYDFTVRPQLVKPDINPQYYSLIKAFEKITGIGALLNTSLNLHGHPIACSEKDAIDVFLNSGLDGLLLPGILLLKVSQS